MKSCELFLSSETCSKCFKDRRTWTKFVRNQVCCVEGRKGWCQHLQKSFKRKDEGNECRVTDFEIISDYSVGH